MKDAYGGSITFGLAFATLGKEGLKLGSYELVGVIVLIRPVTLIYFFHYN